MPEVFRRCDVIGWMWLRARIYVRSIIYYFTVEFEFSSIIWKFKHELHKRVLLNRNVCIASEYKKSSLLLLGLDLQNPLRHIANCLTQRPKVHLQGLITLLGLNFRHNSVLILITLLGKFGPDFFRQFAALNQ